MRRPAIWLSCLFVLLGVAGSMSALAADYYLKIEGIDGDSIDKGHEKWIRGTSAEWLTPTGAPASGAAPAEPGRIKIKFPSLSKTTPLLTQALATNEVHGAGIERALQRRAHAQL